MNSKFQNYKFIQFLENFDEQTIDLRKQIESMEAQIRADKEFIDVIINISQLKS